MLESLRGSAAAFRVQVAQAERTQEQLLRGLVSHHARCEYGRRHDFENIASAADWANRVPIVRYENLRADVDRMAGGEPDVLLSGSVLAFEETGGSSGGHKLIPYTERSLAAFRAGLTVWLDDLYAGDDALHHGTAYWSISPAGRARRTTAGGIPIGLDSDLSYLGPALASEIAATLSVPADIAEISDLPSWRLATCTHLAGDEQLALISVWSPTFLLQLLDFIEANPDTIARGIPSPARAARVKAALSQSPPDYQNLWPRLRLLSCWTHGSSKAFAARLARRLPGVAMQGKGLLATEALISMPLRDCEWPVLAISSGYVELLDDAGFARPATSAEVGGEYEVLVSNESGLYRYALGDRVRVQGFSGTAPLFEFLGRAGITSDLVGEKLDEAFVARALNALGVEFAALAPDTNGYVLLLDEHRVSHEAASAFAQACDGALRSNPQYAYARDLGQLQSVRDLRCQDPLARYLAWRVKTGQRLGDVKPPALITDSGWRSVFVTADATGSAMTP
jgi:hypothetical protein